MAFNLEVFGKHILSFGSDRGAERRVLAYIQDLTEQRSVSTLKNPQDWLKNALGISSLSGRSINEETAMKFSAVFSCIKILSETEAMLPINLHKRDGKSTNIAFDYPGHKILKYPNERMTGYVWRELMMSHALSTGNGYSRIIRDNLANPVELQILSPKDVTPFIHEGKVWYKVKGVELPLKYMDVFHLRAFGFDPVLGKSPIKVASESVSMALNTQAYGAEVFNNGSAKRMAFKSPGKVDPDVQKQIREDWEKIYGKGSDPGKVAFLQGGLDFVEVGINPEDAQFIATMKFSVEEIARIYRVQMHLLQSLDKATNNNIEKQSREFVDYTMMPWLIRVEQEADLKLVRERDRGQIFCKHNVKGLLRGDIKSQTDHLVKMLGNGVYNPDKVLSILDENPREDGKGGEYFTPLNMVDPANLKDSEN